VLEPSGPGEDRKRRSGRALETSGGRCEDDCDGLLDQGVLSVCTRLIAAIRFGPWQMRHSSFCGFVNAMPRG